MDKIEELSKHNLPRTVYNAISSTKDETSINNMKHLVQKVYRWQRHLRFSSSELI